MRGKNCNKCILECSIWSFGQSKTTQTKVLDCFWSYICPRSKSTQLSPRTKTWTQKWTQMPKSNWANFISTYWIGVQFTCITIHGQPNMTNHWPLLIIKRNIDFHLRPFPLFCPFNFFCKWSTLCFCSYQSGFSTLSCFDFFCIFALFVS